MSREGPSTPIIQHATTPHLVSNVRKLMVSFATTNFKEMTVALTLFPCSNILTTFTPVTERKKNCFQIVDRNPVSRHIQQQEYRTLCRGISCATTPNIQNCVLFAVSHKAATMQDAHVKLNPELSWQKRHSTRRTIFSQAKWT